MSPHLSLLFALAGAPLLSAAPVIERSSQTGSSLQLRLYEGLTETEIPVAATASTSFTSENGVTTRWEIQEREGDVRLCQLVVTNDSSEERRLEPSLRWEFAAEASFTIYWDGSTKERPLSTQAEPITQSNIRRLAPWSSVYGERDALMVGLHPFELRSYLRSEYQPGDSVRSISCSTRLVLAPGQSDTITFVFSEFPIRFGGQRETVQRLHDAFPEVYSPHPDVNPAVNGVSAQYWASRVTADKIPGQVPQEFMRRMHATWDWSYTPFKRTGDHWGREEDWEYEPNIPFKDSKATIIGQNFYFNEMSREKFMELRERYFNGQEGSHGLMFYSPAGVWVESKLARAKYADAIIDDPNFSWERTRWVTGWDKELKVLPWYTSYEKTLREDFARIAKEYNIGGVALDVARGGPKYRGPATKQPLTVRAYDEQGVYIDQGVGVAKFIDYLHTLPLRSMPEKRLAVVGNPETGGQTYTVTARYDSGMFEGPPYHPHHESIPLARYVLGRKPLTWWAGWGYQKHAVPNWRLQNREEFIKTIKGLTDYVIFASYEYAGIPTLVMEFGVPKLIREIPGITETIQRGWQAVVPVRHDFTKELHLARYGRGLTTRLFFGNPYDEAESITLKIDESYIGKAAYVWAARHHDTPLTMKHTGEATVITTELPSREPALFDAVAALPESYRGEVVTAFAHSDARRELTLSLRPEGKLAAGTEIRFPKEAGMLLPEVTLNGKAAKVTEDGDELTLSLPAGKEAEMKLVWTAKWAGEGLERLASWPFLNESGDPAFQIVTPSAEAERLLRQRLSDYFLFAGRVVLNKPGVVPVKFVTADEADASGPRLVLQSGGEAKITVPSEQEIVVSYGDLKEANVMLDHLFRRLDERYPYKPGFLGTWGIGHEMLQQYKMVGEIVE